MKKLETKWEEPAEDEVDVIYMEHRCVFIILKAEKNEYVIKL